ncbi:unnamed protein product [Cylicocyclus nassatus]|uniref:Uncharacterized protein n=1 Tax=Cylicocyclus nassatus TaxID=53992 RepID=A0AA36M0S2_CYLNA|nr:unnamed protein product [Cylicocyclus nassatus]
MNVNENIDRDVTVLACFGHVGRDLNPSLHRLLSIEEEYVKNMIEVIEDIKFFQDALEPQFDKLMRLVAKIQVFYEEDETRLRHGQKLIVKEQTSSNDHTFRKSAVLRKVISLHYRCLYLVPVILAKVFGRLHKGFDYKYHDFIYNKLIA